MGNRRGLPATAVVLVVGAIASGCGADAADGTEGDAQAPTEPSEPAESSSSGRPPSRPSSSSSGGPSSSSSSSSSGETSSSSSGGSSSSSSGSSSGGESPCGELRLGPFTLDGSGVVNGQTWADFDSTVSSGPPNEVSTGFLSFSLDGAGSDAPGVYPLGTGGNATAADCHQCLAVVTSQHNYFASGGEVEIEPSSNLARGKFTATLRNVTLVQVTYGPFLEMTVVPNGLCLGIDSTQIDTPGVPDAWTCEPSWYSDSGCQCGCGMVDPGCPADATLASCKQYECGCTAFECPTTIDPDDLTACLP